MAQARQGVGRMSAAEMETTVRPFRLEVSNADRERLAKAARGESLTSPGDAAASPSPET